MNIKEWIKKKEIIYYIIIILITLLMSAPLMVEGFLSTPDVYSHLSRNYNTMQGLKDGQFPPVIVSNFCNGFGYSWNLFYPPLTTYISAIFRLIVPTYVGAMKLSIVVAFLVSGIAMFQLVRKVTKNSDIGLISAILYMTANYFITDVYRRMAMGEVYAYMFFPILFHGLYNIFYDKGKRNYLLTIGACGILLSHNISSLMAVGISILFILFNVKKLIDKQTRKQIWKHLVINAIFIILIVLFFYIPFVEQQMGTEYVAMQEGGMSTKESVSNHALHIYQLVFGKFQYGGSYGLEQGIDNDMFFAIGLPILIPLIFAPIVISKISKEKRNLYWFTLIMGILTSLMATTIFPWAKMPKIILLIQFPWRMLILPTFLLSIIAGINIGKCIENLKVEKLLIITLVILIYSGQYISYVTKFDTNFDEFYLGKTEKIEELAGGNKYCSSFEYLPVKAKTEYTKNRENGIIIINGNAKIENEKKENNNMSFEIKEVEEETKLELPYIYYLGYKINFQGQIINYEESEHGFIQITIPKGKEGKVEISYKGTFLSKIATIISIIGIMGLTVYIFMEEKKAEK